MTLEEQAERRVAMARQLGVPLIVGDPRSEWGLDLETTRLV